MCSKNYLGSAVTVICAGTSLGADSAHISWFKDLADVAIQDYLQPNNDTLLWVEWSGHRVHPDSYKATRAMTLLSESSIVSAASQQVSCTLADETLILQLQTGNYFRLNQVGTATWELIQESHTVREIYLEILGRYEVDSLRWERDLYGLLEGMREAELIEITL
jgi:hypothetical protein